MKEILVSSSYELTPTQLAWFIRCPNGCHKRARFHFNIGGTFDLVCQVNWSHKPLLVTAPRNQFLKVVQEPDWPGHITHRFVDHHRRMFRTIRGHNNVTSVVGSGAEYQYGYSFLPHRVTEPAMPQKTKNYSIIASRMGLLPGHKARTEFVDSITSFWIELGGSIFGRGRTPIETKEKGLDPFMYSLVVENSAIPNYVTEKFTDAILRGTVPIYFGAPNIGEIFPAGSYVQLPELSIDSLRAVMSELGERDYHARTGSLLEAQRLLDYELRFCCWLTTEESEREPESKVTRVLGTELSSALSGLRTGVGRALGRG